MFQRFVLGIMLLAAGFVGGWLTRSELAAKDCEAAGGTWQKSRYCAGVR